MDDITHAICQEILMQRDYLDGGTCLPTGRLVNTIYFGGGTPSLLEENQLREILNAIGYEFDVSSNPEITIEANPEDLDDQKLASLKNAGFNRLSIGVQSFHNAHLKWLNRTHDAQTAITCVEKSRKAGFENINLDLIYAIPAENHQYWKEDLATIVSLRPEHISSYCLTIEPKTVFGNWLTKGKIREVDEDYAATQFEILQQTMNRNGYESYEISNFALPGYESQHNSNYWRQEKYLGLGPSAHSYNGESRQANVSSNPKYIQGIKEGKIPFEPIALSTEDQINEYILTSLRTKWGCDVQYLHDRYHVDLLQIHEPYLLKLDKEGMLFLEDDCLILTDKGKLLADKIASDLFIVK